MKKRYIAFIVMCMISSSFMTACNGSNKDEEVFETNPVEESTIVTTVGTMPPSDIIVTEETENSENNTSEENASQLKSIADAVTSSVEWAKLDQITDETIATEFFKLDLKNANYKDILVMQCPMSAVTAELIIIEANDGKIDDAKADLVARQDKLINVDAFYPDSKAIAENSIVGTYNNIAYFIASENATESEKVLLAELEKAGY